MFYVVAVVVRTLPLLLLGSRKIRKRVATAGRGRFNLQSYLNSDDEYADAVELHYKFAPPSLMYCWFWYVIRFVIIAAAAAESNAAVVLAALMIAVVVALALAVVEKSRYLIPYVLP